MRGGLILEGRWRAFRFAGIFCGGFLLLDGSGFRVQDVFLDQDWRGQ